MLSSKAPFEGDFQTSHCLLLLCILFALLVYYYFPCLSGAGDFFISDITYYFQPFAHFIASEVRKGILPLWNPLLYSGMSQLAIPSPGLFYPPSWLIFMLPFSVGLSIYMIGHQLLGALATFLYLRELRMSRAAAIFGAYAFALCGYMFSLIQNFTLPATVCWFPLALYFQSRSASANFGRASGVAPVLDAGSVSDDSVSAANFSNTRTARLFDWNLLGLGLVCSMIVFCGRPEIGVPCLAVLGLAEVVLLVRSRSNNDWNSAHWAGFFTRCFAIGSGILLAAPVLLPGMEWASLSPRAQGMDVKWVLLWSANWFDWLGIFVSNPLGSLYLLDEKSAMFRHLVLSRGGSLPFVGSSFISSIVISYAICGLFCRRKNLLVALALIFVVSSIMAIGSATPIAPAIVKLSPLLAAFRYPVKLLIVPSMVLILLAVLGLDLILRKQFDHWILRRIAIGWLVVLAFGAVLYFIPELSRNQTLVHFLVEKKFPEYILRTAQLKFGQSLMLSSSIGLFACAAAFLYLKGLWSARIFSFSMTIVLAGILFSSSMNVRLVSKPNFFLDKSFFAAYLKQNLPEFSGKENRFVNLYFDPLTMPPSFCPSGAKDYDEKFYSYSRQMLLHNSLLCSGLPSSFGYEAAETKDYKEYFTEAISWSSQHRKADPKLMTDWPVYRFALISATALINTQVYRYAQSPVPLLDSSLFTMIEENRALNYRIFRVRNPRPRIYFASKVVPVESFADFRKVIMSKDDRTETRAFLENPAMIYVLHRDFESNKALFEEINRRAEKSLNNKTPTEGSNTPTVGGKVSTESSRTPTVGSKTPAEGSKTSTESIKTPIESDTATETGNRIARIELLRSESQVVEIAAESDKEEVLVISDHYYPGWKAELNGSNVPIFKVNSFFRGVVLPAGKNKVTMRYEPDSLRYGIYLAIAGSLLLLSLSAIAARWRMGKTASASASIS